MLCYEPEGRAFLTDSLSPASLIAPTHAAMVPTGTTFSGLENASGRKAGEGFSLVEILVVSGVIGLLLALTVPGLVAFTPSRKSAIHEVSGFLENARSRAMASRTEMIVAFADGTFPGEGAYRSYALFALEGGTDDPPGDRPLRQLSPWRTLPRGMVFAKGGDFELPAGAVFRTLFEGPERRSFPLPSVSAGGDGGSAALPSLHFGTDGGIRFPDFSDADALHLGVVEGFYSREQGRVELTATRPGINGTGTYANGDCLEVGFYTGRTRILTD